MKALIKLLFIALLFSACDEENPLIQINIPDNDFEADGYYDLIVTSSLGGVHSFSVQGTSTKWRQGIAYLEIGPEEPFVCDKTIASLTLSFIPEAVDENSGMVNGTKVSNWGFYSILYWCNDVGQQESHSYDFKSLDGIENLEFGIDKNNVKYITGHIEASFERKTTSEQDVMETISIDIDFTAIE